MRPNKETVDLVKEFEGLELEAYRDPVGIVTIGYGYTNRAGYGPGVKMGDKWTAKQAEEMLAEGLQRFGNEILPHFTRKPTPNQFGAMLSLAYNIGTGAFRKSTCLRRFNAGDIEGAAEALTWFNKAGGKKLRGLVRRREAERALFMRENAANINEGAGTQPDAERSSLLQSQTVQAGLVQVTGAGGAGLTIIGSLEGYAQVVALVCLTAVILGVAWIFRERIKKWAAGDR